jgi:hypothetical protein
MRSGLKLRSDVSPHNRSMANAEHGAKQRPPRRPQKEYEDQRKHQECFAKSRLGVTFVVDVEQHRKPRSHFNTLASSTPKPRPDAKRPLAAITPTATQRRTADRE